MILSGKCACDIIIRKVFYGKLLNEGILTKAQVLVTELFFAEISFTGQNITNQNKLKYY